MRRCYINNLKINDKYDVLIIYICYNIDEEKNMEVVKGRGYVYSIQYHIVWCVKYRRNILNGKVSTRLKELLTQISKDNGFQILEMNMDEDHIHMLISIPPKYSVSQIMGYLKGKSSLMIFDRHANMKYKYGNRHFWARGYYVDTVGRNKKQIQEYIKKQLEEDQIADQMSLKEYIDPFTGSKESKA